MVCVTFWACIRIASEVRRVTHQISSAGQLKPLADNRGRPSSAALVVPRGPELDGEALVRLLRLAFGIGASDRPLQEP